MHKLFLTLLMLTAGHVLAQESWRVCPESLEAKNLEAWRAELIKQVTEHRNYAKVSELMKSCFPGERPACAEDMYHYVAKLAKPNDYTMNMQTPTLNSLEQLPPEFRGVDNQVIIPEKIFKLDKKNPDIMALAYKTRSTGGFDTGANLLIVGISNPEMDIVLQIATDRTDKSDKEDAVPKYKRKQHGHGQNTLTIITRDKTKNPPVGQMRKLYKNGKGYSFNNELSEQSCRSCHTTPFRTISPQGYKVVHHDQKRMTPEQEEYVQKFNDRFLTPYTTWGTAERDGRVNRLGPPIDSHPLGWAPNDSRTRKSEFLKKCADEDTRMSYGGRGNYSYSFNQARPPNIDYSKLADSMDCTMCHNNSYRGKITESFNKSEVIFKILVDQSMPQTHGDLNTDEKIALVNCLYAERRELQEDWRKQGEWMKAKSCRGQQFKGQMIYERPTPSNNSVERQTIGQ